MKKTIIRTAPKPLDNTHETLIRELTRLLFFAAGRTGGSFKIEKAAADRYAAGTGDITIVYEESTRDNGDVHIRVIRDRDTAAVTK